MIKIISILFFLPLLTIAQSNKLYKVKLLDCDKISFSKSIDSTENIKKIKFELLEDLKSKKKGEFLSVMINCIGVIELDKIESFDFFLSIGNREENIKNEENGWVIFYKNRKEKYLKLWCGDIKI